MMKRIKYPPILPVLPVFLIPENVFSRVTHIADAHYFKKV